MNKPRGEVRLLLVEDNRTNQEVGVRMLEHLGYRAVEVAPDGLQALAALAARDFDLVLMDCHLPGIDGYETARRIRARSGAPNQDVPIVATTAAVMDSDRQKCFAAGMNAYLAKPLKMNSLKQVVEEWTNGSTASCEPAAPPAIPKATAATFDGEGFRDSVMGNDTLARRILRRFVDDMPRQIALLAQAVSDGDSPQVRLMAHSIKGAAASVSGQEIRDASWKLEQVGRDGDMTPSLDALRELWASFERARPVMESFCREDSSE
jgi:CheY-like chemotaxis protein/HPt (histidine-containing phosphotransfer) domain-containing protein